MIGEGLSAVLEKRITEAVAADAGRCGLALLHRIKPAAGHVASHILAAKLARTSLIFAHRAKRNNGDDCRSRRTDLRKSFHHALFC